MINKIFFFSFVLTITIIFCSTSFAQILLPYQQKFNGPNFPPFWAQTSTISPRWSISPTSNADGTPNEMMASGTTGIGVSRLIVGPINTTGLTSLNLQFNQVMSCLDTANFSLRIQSSVNATNWTNEAFTLEEDSYNCANTINITINNNVGSSTFIAWTITGNHSLFNNWYIDDIIISQVFTNDVGMSALFHPEVITIPNQSLEMLLAFTGLPIVKNFGSVPQTFLVQMDLMDTSTVLTFTTTVSNLAPGAQVIADFDGSFLPPAGLYTMVFCTQLPGDQNPINDCKSKEFIIDFGNVQRFPLTVNVNNGWNMVSTPGMYDVIAKSVHLWWPGRDAASNVYKFEGSYKTVINTEPGLGYWMKNSANQTYNTGDEWPAAGIMTFAHYPIIVSKGWNLIGGYEKPFPVGNITSIPPDIISAPIYEFSGGYQVADTLTAGYGYWVRTSASGILMIDTSCVTSPLQLVDKKKENTELFKEDRGRIIFIDAAGNNYTLYGVNEQANLDKYELPPPPPAEVFDIRFNSGKIAEDLSSLQSIEMNGVVYPVKIKVENMQIKITDIFNSEIDKELKPGEELIIHNKQINKLIVQSSPSNAIVTYSLDQNYPNPFNPTTKISWQSPADGKQTLKVFDVLGNEVAVLVDEFRAAGRYEATFNAGNLASGIYIYRLQAGEFIQTKKMIFMK